MLRIQILVLGFGTPFNQLFHKQLSWNLLFLESLILENAHTYFYINLVHL